MSGIIKNMSSAGAFVTRAALENPNLNAYSVRCLAWMLSHSEGWEIRVPDLLKRLPLGVDAWRTARRQLIKEGYLVHTKYQGKGGKWIHEYHIFRDPKAPEEETK